MAPFQGPGKREVIALLSTRDAARRLPLTLGLHAPQAQIVIEDGRWLLRELVSSEKKAAAVAAAGAASGHLMPEHFFAALVPGRALIDAPDARALIKALESMAWTYGGQP